MRSPATSTKTAPAEPKKTKKAAEPTPTASFVDRPKEDVGSVLKTIAEMVANNGITTSRIDTFDIEIDGVKIRRVKASIDIIRT